MACVNLPEGPYTSNLIEVTELNDSSFNPRDYLDFSKSITVKTDSLISVANVKGEVSDEESVMRIKSDCVDRATGQVYEQQGKPENVSCTKFDAGHILFHKYRARIGRIGITESDGYADNHFLVIRPFAIDNYYLLLAMRSVPVLIQLPYRETTRPGVWNDDVSQLRIPRLDTTSEEQIGKFIKSIFSLRKRARTVLGNMLEDFDKGVSSRLPTNNYFPLNVDEFIPETLDPGYYFMKVLEWTFPKNVEVQIPFDVIQPPSADSGAKYATLTIKDYEFEGIRPLIPKKVDKLFPKNFAREGDIILNKLHSKRTAIAKATVVVRNLSYLEEVGLTIQELNGESQVPVYSELFIIRRRKESAFALSPYYLAVMLNSQLFQHIFAFIMSGSTGRQRIRKEKLVTVKIPLLEEHLIKAISVATQICLDVFSETLRMLIQMCGIYNRVIQGKGEEQELISFMTVEEETVRRLEGNYIEEAESEAVKTKGMSYLFEPL